MDTATFIKSESQIIENIFNSDTCDQLAWKWTHSAFAEFDRDKLLKINMDLTPELLPHTELELAKQIGELLKDKAVYVKAEGVWYIWSGDEYRKTEGDWFLHKAIKEIAGVYKVIIAEIVNRCTADAKVNDDTKTEKMFDRFSSHFTFNNKLQSSAILDALTKVLKSELDEIPAGITKDVPFLTIGYLEDRVALPHLVQDHIPSVGIGQLYGQSSAGKTIAIVDLALSICAGLKTWQGLPLNVNGPQQILYIAAEGGQPFWDFVAAWKAKHPEVTARDLEGFIVWDAGVGQTLTIGTSLEVAPGLFGLQAMKDKVKASGLKPAIVIFDPQANILSGVDENSNVEMVAALKPIQDWASEGQFLALLIHHEGKKDSGSGRGASSQKAMMDLLIKLTKNGDLTRTLSFEKVKGSKDPDKKLNYTIETMEFSGGSGSGGVAVPAGAVLSFKERAERVGFIDISKVRAAIQNGASSTSGIEKATGIGRNKVSEHVRTLQAQGIIQNLGGDTRPRWTLISPDHDASAA